MISQLLTLVLGFASYSCNNYNIILVPWYKYNMYIYVYLYIYIYIDIDLACVEFQLDILKHFRDIANLLSDALQN